MILALVLALHGVAWRVLSSRSVVVHQPPASAPVRVSLRWLPPPRETTPQQLVRAPNVHPSAPSPRTPRAGVATAVRQRSPATAPTLAEPEAPTAQASALPTEAAASGAGVQPSGILTSPATRQAIVDAARAPSLAELPGTTRRAGPAQQLGSAIASGARGDCDKGEFAGGGMGLLSLPFWAAAKLRGVCSR